MKKVLLLCALLPLVGCQPTAEDKVMELVKASTEVLVPESVQLRELSETLGGSVCGKISYEGVKGRTDFLPFYTSGDRLEIITEEGYLPGKEGARWAMDDICTTTQPVQN